VYAMIRYSFSPKSWFWGVQGVHCQKPEVSLRVPVDTPRWPDGCPGVTLGRRSGVGDKGTWNAIDQDDACHHGAVAYKAASTTTRPTRFAGGTASASPNRVDISAPIPFPLNSWRYKHIQRPLDTDMQPDSQGRQETSFFAAVS
jgi:hypothetical protein